MRPRHDHHVAEALSRAEWLLALAIHVALVTGQAVAGYLLVT